ncbi:MAG TPA: MOSC domain-containing protein [Candidatus Limnocylindria bacterium]|nr:MOSC domain-containing protein [Candidatus Limnocylindria bacterium]
MDQRIGRIASVNVSPGGVPKLPIDGAWVGTLGLEGDGHTEPVPSHGGPDKAVSLFSVESIARVAADGHTAFPGAYGENLTLSGIELGSLTAGDRLAIGHGGLLIELTGHAAPCQTLAHWFVERRIARISPKVHPEDSRWYARVLAEGPVAAGDLVRPMAGGTHETRPDEPGYEASVDLGSV